MPFCVRFQAAMPPEAPLPMIDDGIDLGGIDDLHVCNRCGAGTVTGASMSQPRGPGQRCGIRARRLRQSRAKGVIYRSAGGARPGRNHVGKQIITASGKAVTQFRDYENALPRVEAFYAANHKHQTLDFVLEKKREYLSLNRETMTVWEALEYPEHPRRRQRSRRRLHPDRARAADGGGDRAADQPRWLVATGLVHDLGKILCLFGEPQWAVVGDTFPVGCRWSPKIVHSQFFSENPDRLIPVYSTENGIYEPRLRPRQRAHVVGPRRVRRTTP